MLKKPQRRNSARNFKHMTIFFDLKLFKQNNTYEEVFCAMFRAKQTKFEPLDARKFQKR